MPRVARSSTKRFSPSRLCDLREGAGLSRPALAAAMERSENSIWNWERGVTAPRVDQLGQLAQVLDCSVDDFFAPVNEDDPAVQAGPSKNASGGTRRGIKA